MYCKPEDVCCYRRARLLLVDSGGGTLLLLSALSRLQRSLFVSHLQCPLWTSSYRQSRSSMSVWTRATSWSLLRLAAPILMDDDRRKTRHQTKNGILRDFPAGGHPPGGPLSSSDDEEPLVLRVGRRAKKSRQLSAPIRTSRSWRGIV